MHIILGNGVFAVFVVARFSHARMMDVESQTALFSDNNIEYNVRASFT